MKCTKCNVNDQYGNATSCCMKCISLAQYGITFLDYTRLLQEQNYSCAICREFMKKPMVDHDHKTGEVRGLLCTLCNSGLGFFRDRIRFLAAAIVYLEDHGKSYH